MSFLALLTIFLILWAPIRRQAQMRQAGIAAGAARQARNADYEHGDTLQDNKKQGTGDDKIPSEDAYLETMWSDVINVRLYDRGGILVIKGLFVQAMNLL